MALIKPQFEAPKELVGEKGVVRDPAVHFSVVQEIVRFVDTTDWHAQGLDFSPIKGPEGNIEYICHMKNRAGEAAQIDVEAVVTASHEAL